MFDGYAKPECLHGEWVANLLSYGSYDSAGSNVVCGVDSLQACDVVAACSPVDGGQVRAVMNAEVLEGRQELTVKRVPKSQLGCYATIEVVQN